LHPVKALTVLFNAMAKIREQGKLVVLDLAGDGDSAYVTKLRRQVDILGLQENVVWHGQVDDAKKRELYANAECFALLSHHENFGLAAAEAMGAGLPVVVSDQVGLAPDVVKFHAGIVVPVGDVAATAQALVKFMDHSTRVYAGDRARQLVQQYYSSKAFADGLEEMYRDAMFKQ
jgi:glycosyltransferase involved in cell wall biosynthesis